MHKIMDGILLHKFFIYTASTTNTAWSPVISSCSKCLPPNENICTVKIPNDTSLEGDKVSMLTHTYPHKLLRKIEVTICNHQADSPLCGVMSDLVICKFKKSMAVHDTECPYWDQVSLNNPNPLILALMALFNISLKLVWHHWYDRWAVIWNSDCILGHSYVCKTSTLQLSKNITPKTLDGIKNRDFHLDSWQ